MKPRIDHGIHRHDSAQLAGSAYTRPARGFSLIELLIVVAIILIIAAIAIPSFLRARLAANESSAVGSLRTVTSAQVTYQSLYNVGFADTLVKLGGPPGGAVDQNGAHILDWVVGCAAEPCLHSGYNFSIESVLGSPPADYKAVAVPVSLGVTGNKGFCSSQANLLMMDPSGATACTNPID